MACIFSLLWVINGDIILTSFLMLKHVLVFACSTSFNIPGSGLQGNRCTYIIYYRASKPNAILMFALKKFPNNVVMSRCSIVHIVLVDCNP